MVHCREFKPPSFGYTGKLRPAYVSARRAVPEHIQRPDYANDREGRAWSEEVAREEIIRVYTPEEIEKARAASQLARQALDIGAAMIKPGITTDAIDIAVHDFIISHNAYPSPLNYYKFPKSLCTSVNEVICHGIPDARPLEDGDIINLDVTVYLNGYHGDLNETYFVGDVDEESKRLVQASYDCLQKAIAMVKPGTLYRELGTAIESHAKSQSLSVVRSYCGHGIGELFHTSPSVPHYARNKARGVMKVGHVFTIEPMINLGGWKDKTWPDNWTSVTTDGKRSAQFEHTMVVTENGVEILTARQADSPYSVK